MDDLLQCLPAIPLFVIFFVAMSWLSGNRNTPAGGGVRGGNNIITTDVPWHSENNAKAAADLAAQRHFGRNRGEEKDVYVSYHPGNKDAHHAENRYVEWLTKVVPGHDKSTAEEVGVYVHIVPVAERDRITAEYTRLGTAWINPPTEGFDPETGIIDEGKGISTEHTPGAGLWGFLQFVALAISILFVGGSFCALLYYVNEILFPAW